MRVQVANNVLNLVELQEKLDRVIFEQIDTSQNWEKAQENLAQLHKQIVQYYKQILVHTKGELPKANAYWLLFTRSAAKVIYFYHYAQQHGAAILSEPEKQALIAAYVAATKILPNNLAEANEELLDEMTASIQSVDDTLQIQHESNELTQCLAALKQYVSK